MNNTLHLYDNSEEGNTPREIFVNYLAKEQEMMTPVPTVDNYLLNLNVWDWEQVWHKHEVARELYFEDLMIEFDYTDLPILPEVKAYVFRKAVNMEWGADSIRVSYNRCIKLYLKFISDTYPNIESCTEIPFNTLDWRWKAFLEAQLEHVSQSKRSFVEIMYQTIEVWIAKETGTIWEKDVWVIDWLEEYDLSRSKSSNSHQISFKQVESEDFKRLLKKYAKQRLLSKVNYTWGTAQTYNGVLVRFLNFISTKHKDWTNLNDLSREDILDYQHEISLYPAVDKSHYVSYRMLVVRSFLEYIQLMDYEEQPKTPIIRLIYAEDVPNGGRSKVNVDRYISENILAQIYKNINMLPNDVRLIIIIMHNTGLRISDTLELTTSCLVEKAGQYWIKTNVKKTKLNNHMMPITNNLAETLKERIASIELAANDYVNPNRYLFPSPVKTKAPLSQDNVLRILNKFAEEADIREDNGERYRFHNHAFRHTFAMSCLNNGMDILTLQQLLGHASNEMTLYYAKLYDSTKREIFEKVVESGVFSFNSDTSLKQEDVSSIIGEDLDNFWLSFKMNAIDTPYGICMQRSSGKCHFAKQPPCLTCNGGKPCKNLCIGVNSSDADKYKVLISSAASLIEIGRRNENEVMQAENTELLKLYQEIYNAISAGGIIYGRADRLKAEIKKKKEGEQ